jgi:WD40 repeat protein
VIRWLLILLLSVLFAAGKIHAQAVDSAGYYREPYLVVEPGTHVAPIRAADVDAKGRFVVTAGDTTVRVWSGEDGRLVRTIWLPAAPNAGKAFAVAISPDGQTIAAGGWATLGRGKENIYLFDRATGRMIHRFGDLPAAINVLAFSRDGTRLAAGMASGGVRLFDPQSKRQIGADADYAGECYGVAFFNDGKIVATSLDGYVRIYNSGMPSPPRKSLIGERLMGVSVSPDGTRIAVAPRDRAVVRVLDTETLKIVFSTDASGLRGPDMANVAWSSDGNLLFAGGRIENASGGRVVRVWRVNDPTTWQDFEAGKDTIEAILPLPDGRVVIAGQDPFVAMYSPNRNPIWQVLPKTIDYRQSDLLLGQDGSIVELRTADSGLAFRYEVASRVLQMPPKQDRSLLPPSTTGLPVYHWHDSYEPVLGDSYIELKANEVSRALAISADKESFVLAAEYTLRRFSADGSQLWYVETTSSARAVNLTPDDRLAVVAFKDGTVRWFRFSDGVELLALFVDAKNRRWVIWTPQGFYAASPGAEDLIRWIVGNGPDVAGAEYAIGAYRDQFYRPDVIERVLEELSVAEALKLADQRRVVGTEPASLALVAERKPPTVAIVDPAEGTDVGRATLEVAYEIHGMPKGRITNLRVLVNNREVASRSGLTLSNDGSLAGELEVPVAGLRPTLTLIAENEYGSSIPASVRLTGGVAANEATPVLFVLAIGVTKYQHRPDLELSFPDDDVREFTERMSKQPKRLYRDVKVRRLVDEEASSIAIRDGFVWLRREMGKSDVAIIFISAHGQADWHGNLYLVSRDAELGTETAMQQTAVSWRDINEEIEVLAARGRTVVFLDACKSGKATLAVAGQAPDVAREANELIASGTDVTIFTSSSGDQFSREDDALHHGVFTYALLEALDGKIEIFRHDVTATRLGEYLQSRVNALTDGSQTPQVALPQGQTDSTLFGLQ